ncbi:MAG TPA: hypothetical protein VET85_10445 [Stellaceae bacterium]|nr:hypothetical protein [Stellaceae bacterium]
MPFASKVASLIGIILGGFITQPALANLVQNGDFAGGSGAGWTFGVYTVAIGAGAQFSQSPSGASPNATFTASSLNGQSAWYDTLDLGYGTISQTLVTTPGQTYQISYLFGVAGFSPGNFFAVFGGQASLPADALTLSGGQFVAAPSNYLAHPPANCGQVTGCGLFYGSQANANGVTVEQETLTGVATGALTTIEFAGACPGCSFYVTDVSVTPLSNPNSVPEPPMTLLLSVAALGIVAGARRGNPVTRGIG